MVNQSICTIHTSLLMMMIGGGGRGVASISYKQQFQYTGCTMQNNCLLARLCNKILRLFAKHTESVWIAER